MNFSCNNCDLNYSIESYKEKLNNLIIDKKQNLLDDEVIRLSELIDELVYKCVFCKNKLKVIPSLELGLKNIFGTHSTFYYYGNEHLFTSMYSYILEGIKNNEMVYISMEESIYSKLLQFLIRNNVPAQHIKFRPVKELIISNKSGDLKELKKKINEISLENKVKNYNGIRWIGQPTYAIQTTSQKDFLDWEINLSKALNNTNVSLICIYDAYDYMHEEKFINKEVINKSLHTHSYILKNSYLEKIN